MNRMMRREIRIALPAEWSGDHCAGMRDAVVSLASLWELPASHVELVEVDTGGERAE